MAHGPLNVLVTSSRMPFALDEVRKIGRRGHRVYTVDSLGSAPGSHSRYTAEAFITAAPRDDPARFVEQLRRIVESRAIDLVVPCFEEVFWISRHLGELGGVEVFASDAETLDRLHDKSRFAALARSLGLRVPETVLVRSIDELDHAITRFPQFLAQPAFSRGGVDMLTNVGPLAAVRKRSECRPTELAPWIVQEFVHGSDLCTFSVVRHGKVRAHVAYVHPRTIEHTGGITLESVDDDRALEAVETIVDATGHHGQVAFDFIRSERGLYCIECNVRPTLGVALLDDALFVDALLSEGPTDGRVVPAGVKRKITWGLVRNIFRHPREIALDLRALFSGGKDVHLDLRDPMPALYQMVAALAALRRRREAVASLPEHSRMLAAYLHDSAWDGAWLDAA